MAVLPADDEWLGMSLDARSRQVLFAFKWVLFIALPPFKDGVSFEH